MEDTNEKLCTVNGASQNNDIRNLFRSHVVCMGTQAHMHTRPYVHTLHTQCVYACVCIIYTTCKQV